MTDLRVASVNRVFVAFDCIRRFMNEASDDNV